MAHARFLAWLLRTRCGIPSWDVPTGSFLAEPGPPARDHALVVFSQGLSPNARPPLARPDAYRAAVLITAAEQETGERAGVVRAARERGVVVVPLGCEPEYEVLLRIVGPMVGFATAIRLANAAGAGIEAPPENVASAIALASSRLEARLAALDPAVFSDPVTLLATDGWAALAHNLAAKVQEGMFLPWPAAVDALELAHGTLQEAHGKRRTFVALRRGAPLEDELLARARAALDPDHGWLDLEARLQGPLAIFEHEAMMNALVLACVEARRLDQREWPAKGNDDVLYGVRGPDDLRSGG
jgi:creatinine amidohydrolase